MSCKVNDIIKQAQSWLGYKESNGTHKQIIDVYNSHKPLARGYAVKYTDDWCATFVSAVAIKCNATDIIPTECGCERMIDLFKSKGTWIEDGKITPRVGDIIFYDWDKKDTWADHVGIVESVTNGSIRVIEGNKSDSVSYRAIKVGDATIRGYGRPNYEIETVQPSSDKIEVDGEWGQATTRLAQKVFGTTVDGIISNQYKVYASSNTGLLSSTFEWKDNPSKNGSELIKALQKWCGAEVDGFVGPDFVTHMQQKLGTPVDGKFDRYGQGIKAFQEYLNSKV